MNRLQLTRLLIRASNGLPYFMALNAALMLGRLGYWIYRSERKQALKNIRACYPEEPHSTHTCIAMRAFQHMTVTAMELFRFSGDRSYADQVITVRNLHHVTEALDGERGVLLVSAHYGNLPLLPFAFEGICREPAYIMRWPTRKLGQIVAQFRAYRDAYLKPLSSFRSLNSSIGGAVSAGHLLKRGNAVIVVADLTWGSGAVPVTFLGVPHYMSRAPASLSLLTGASLIPAIISRNADGSYEVVVEPPIERPTGTSRRDAELAMTESFAKVLERRVKACPEQWFWMHRHVRLAARHSYQA